ncbi:MAG: hypothetical protein JW942_01390, partial [Opitutales bacterium]|nr:hypothetical protein [Opitutales bacterium]
MHCTEQDKVLTESIFAFSMHMNTDLTLNIMEKSYFNVPAIAFEGASSRNAFAFKHYNPEEVV